MNKQNVNQSSANKSIKALDKHKKAQIVVITSGKGGVGKTTTSAAMGVGLAQRGYKTVIIDFDVGLRNIDLMMGCERRLVYDFINLVNGEANINQTLIKDKYVQKLYILPASQTRDKTALHENGVEAVLYDLAQQFDYIICDSPAGIEKGAILAMKFADDAVVVTNPEVSSVRDSDRVLGMLGSETYRSKENLDPVKAHLLLTRYMPDRVNHGEMLSIDDVRGILAIDLLGVIPESESILKASNAGRPVTTEQSCNASKAYMDAVDRFTGTSVPLRFISEEKRGVFKRLFKGGK